MHGPPMHESIEEPEHAMTMPEDCLTEARVKGKNSKYFKYWF